MHFLSNLVKKKQIRKKKINMPLYDNIVFVWLTIKLCFFFYLGPLGNHLLTPGFYFIIYIYIYSVLYIKPLTLNNEQDVEVI